MRCQGDVLVDTSNTTTFHLLPCAPPGLLSLIALIEELHQLQTSCFVLSEAEGMGSSAGGVRNLSCGHISTILLVLMRLQNQVPPDITGSQSL